MGITERCRLHVADIGVTGLYFLLEPRLANIDLGASGYRHRKVSRYQLAHPGVALGMRGSAKYDSDNVLFVTANGSD
jgi:hypothetical protein